MTDSAAYDAYYFEHCCGVPYGRDEHWLRFFGRIADLIVSDLAPETVLDAGCAMGILVEALRDRGVDAWGIDVSDYALERVREDIKPYCRHASVTEPLELRYDLIVCVEVLEHLSREDALTALDNFAAHTDSLLFSSSPLDFKEPTHVNVQPPEWWAEQLARRGLVHDLEFDAAAVTEWAGLYRRAGRVASASGVGVRAPALASDAGRPRRSGIADGDADRGGGGGDRAGGARRYDRVARPAHRGGRPHAS